MPFVYHLLCLWWQLHSSVWTEFEWSWGESSSTIFSKAVNMDTKNTTRVQIIVMLIMALQKYLHSPLQAVHILHTKKGNQPLNWLNCLLRPCMGHSNQNLLIPDLHSNGSASATLLNFRTSLYLFILTLYLALWWLLSYPMSWLNNSTASKFLTFLFHSPQH